MTRSNVPNPIGAHPLTPDDGRRKRRPLWLALLAALLIAALIIAGIVLLARHHKKQTAAPAAPVALTTSGVTQSPSADATSAAAVSTPAATTAPAGSASASAAGAAATAGVHGVVLTAGTAALLPAPADDNVDLAKYVGKDATAKGALVLSSPAANGFWIGSSTENEVWVQLLLPGLVSPHPVRKGDHVSFPATVKANPDSFAKSAGVTDAEGAARLTAQKAHLQVKKPDITFN